MEEIRTFVRRGDITSAIVFDPETSPLRSKMFERDGQLYYDTAIKFYGGGRTELKPINKGDYLIPWKADGVQMYELKPKESFESSFVEVELKTS